MMKLQRRLIFFSLTALSFLLWSVNSMGAELEWYVEEEASLDSQPLDLDASPDGEWVFVLMRGEIQEGYEL